jgi:hypothetical protein
MRDNEDDRSITELTDKLNIIRKKLEAAVVWMTLIESVRDFKMASDESKETMMAAIKNLMTGGADSPDRACENDSGMVIMSKTLEGLDTTFLSSGRSLWLWRHTELKDDCMEYKGEYDPKTRKISNVDWTEPPDFNKG